MDYIETFKQDGWIVIDLRMSPEEQLKFFSWIGATPNPAARFEPGEVVITPLAVQVLERDLTDPHPLLDRHLTGDWGKVPPEDVHANEFAVDHGGRIMSAYDVNGERIWILTEAGRHRTTILTPEEY